MTYKKMNSYFEGWDDFKLIMLEIESERREIDGTNVWENILEMMHRHDSNHIVHEINHIVQYLLDNVRLPVNLSPRKWLIEYIEETRHKLEYYVANKEE